MNYQDTSREAWESHDAETLDGQILRAIGNAPRDGIICDDIERVIGRSHQATSGNLRHLVENGLVVASGEYGLTRTGRRAMKWVLAGRAKQVIKIGKVDLAQIECRVLNTLAGQFDVVEKFRDRVDLYSELASQFYGRPVSKNTPAERGTGKQLELSCGYGAGGPTIVRTARAGTYGPPVYLTDEQGLAARDLYRSSHGYVTALWERAAQMLWLIAAGHSAEWRPPGQTNGCMIVHDKRIFGPGTDGDRLWLDFSSLERVRLDNGEEVWRHRVRNGYRKTYGARLVENVVQWLARIIISQAMVRVSRLGYQIPLTVHDDIFVLIPANRGDMEEQLERIRQEVARPVEWLKDCPIEAEAELLDALDK